MSDEVLTQIDELWDQADALPMGPARTSLWEQAVVLADSIHQDDLAFELRGHLVESATFGGEMEKALVAYTRRLAYADAHLKESPYQWMNLLWQSKWILLGAEGFSKFTRAQLDRIAEEITGRFQSFGSTLQVIYQIRCLNAQSMGDPAERVDHWYRLWRETPRDPLSDCLACETSNHVWYLIRAGREQEALEVAEPILSGGQQCERVPHSTMADLLLSLCRLGRWEQAESHRRQAVPAMITNPDYLYQFGQVLVYLGLRQDWQAGGEILQTTWTWALETFDAKARFEWARGTRLFLQRYAHASHDQIALALPRAYTGYRSNGVYWVADLLAWLEQQLEATARAFDRRNGSPRYRELLGESQSWNDLARSVPVSGSGSKADRPSSSMS